jgi:predicted exporter
MTSPPSQWPDKAMSLALKVLAIAVVLYVAARLILAVLPVLAALGVVVVIGIIIRLIFYHINRW